VLLLIHYSQPALINFLSAENITFWKANTWKHRKWGNAQENLQASDLHMKQWNS
jgi:hypothetical protein